MGTAKDIRVDVPRIDAGIEVDVHWSEPVWQQAARLTGFSEYAPDDGRPAVSRTRSPARTTTAPLWLGRVSGTGRNFGFRYSLTGIDPDFGAATGFIGRGAIVHGNLTNQYSSYGPPPALLEKWTGDVQLDGVWKYGDFLAGRTALERKLHLNSNFTVRGGWHAGFSVLVERYGYDPSLYSTYAPGTVLFAGYGAMLSDPNSATDAGGPVRHQLRRTRDGFFLKVSYLFRL